MVTTDRSTSNVPGPTGRHFYGENEDEQLFIWRGPADRQNMPVIVYVPPGHTFNPGERVMDPHTSSTPALGDAVDMIYDAYGWPIIGIQIRPPYSADSPKNEPFGNQPWPGQFHSVIRALAYLKENANNTALWGANGSIDPNRILMMGSSSGHTLALLAACIPPDATGLSGGMSLSARALAVDHRPAAVAGFIGQIDWTQFALNPSVTTGPFRFDVMQYFHGINGSLTNSALPQSIKRSASPWWWRRYLRPDGTKFWQSWGRRPTSGPGRNLTPELWAPGTIQNVEPQAFYDPHHYFQAKPWDDALKLLGVSSRTIWGGADDNGAGFNNDAIDDLIVTATSSNSTDRILYSGGGFDSGTAVRLTAIDPLAAPLAEGVVYYTSDATDAGFKLSSAPGGAAIDITGADGSLSVRRLDVATDLLQWVQRTLRWPVVQASV